ncbi:MAG TPA: restriction endonuclease subunit S [Dokdonella sp.]|uniref:restriction endonuclease subunit S n=1 Tax=Dokdonella sp. TaxID=2291710 RepID=UPI002D801F14|nr:restriction endonuclease subunit S [Dokdonella sp.]HET9034224.1 restriction endonuclease subunit S [Dokdonella sp.]
MEVKEAAAAYLKLSEFSLDGVTPGFKRTELGAIPEDWEVSTVGSEFSIQLGKMLDAEKNVGISKPFLGNRAIQWGRIDPSCIGQIRLTIRDLQRYRLREGDLLVCEGGEVGRAAIWRNELDECYYQKALHRLRPKREYDTTLMLNVLQKHASSGMLQNFVTQTSIAHLPKDKFEDVPIPLPGRIEQKAIAEALSDADALIESLEHLIAKKRQIKQGAMQALLTGKQRLPGFGGDLESKRLDQLGRWVGGMTPSMRNPSYWHGGTVPWISSGDVKFPRLKSTSQYVTAAALKDHTTTLVPENSIVVVMRSGILRKFFPVAMNTIPMAINQDLKALIPESGMCAEYILHALIGSGNEILARCLKSGTTVESIEFGWLKSFTILVPGREEQTAIATILTDMDTELTELETRLTKTRQLKQGMMQELLTGRIRLV